MHNAIPPHQLNDIVAKIEEEDFDWILKFRGVKPGRHKRSHTDVSILDAVRCMDIWDIKPIFLDIAVLQGWMTTVAYVQTYTSHDISVLSTRVGVTIGNLATFSPQGLFLGL